MVHSFRLRNLARVAERRVWFVLWLVICPSSLFAQPSAANFEAANALYYESKFPEAAAAYEKLLQSGHVSGPLYFNLGNSWFKSGHIGQAIACYRRAERLIPRDPDLRANLLFARNQVQGPTVLPTRTHQWLQKLTLNEWTILSAGTVWLWLLLLSTSQWLPALKRSIRAWAIALGLVALVSCAFLGAALVQARGQVAVVVSPDALVREGPVTSATTAFPVHDGAELRVLEKKDEWLFVSASADNRRTGWLPASQAILIPREE